MYGSGGCAPGLARNRPVTCAPGFGWWSFQLVKARRLRSVEKGITIATASPGLHCISPACLPRTCPNTASVYFHKLPHCLKLKDFLYNQSSSPVLQSKRSSLSHTSSLTPPKLWLHGSSFRASPSPRDQSELSLNSSQDLSSQRADNFKMPLPCQSKSPWAHSEEGELSFRETPRLHSRRPRRKRALSSSSFS